MTYSVQSYVQSTGLELVAAAFFTVEVGQPTGNPFLRCSGFRSSLAC